MLVGHTHNQEAETKGFMHSASLFLLCGPGPELRESYCPLLGIFISINLIDITPHRHTQIPNNH